LPAVENVVAIARGGAANIPGLATTPTPLDTLSSELLDGLLGSADGKQLLAQLVQYFGEQRLIALQAAAHAVVASQSKVSSKKNTSMAPTFRRTPSS
jgi:hypothetical protein